MFLKNEQFEKKNDSETIWKKRIDGYSNNEDIVIYRKIVFN